MLKLVKFDCGCVGTLPNDSGASVLVYACDGGRDDPPLDIRARDMSGKTFKALSDDSVTKFVLALSSLVNDGWRLREVRSLLGEPLLESPVPRVNELEFSS